MIGPSLVFNVYFSLVGYIIIFYVYTSAGRIRYRSERSAPIQTGRPQIARATQRRSCGAGGHRGADRFRYQLAARYERRPNVQAPAHLVESGARHFRARVVVARCGQLRVVRRAQGKVVIASARAHFGWVLRCAVYIVIWRCDLFMLSVAICNTYLFRIAD